MSLGDYLVKNPDTVNQKRVLELGAGTGLAGIVAAQIGKLALRRTNRFSNKRLMPCVQVVDYLY